MNELACYTLCGGDQRRFGSFERFNRVLYGGHAQDGAPERFFTFAGDTPIFMGAVSDYQRNTWCYQAKAGVLMSALAVTPGFVGNGTEKIYSQWFHDSSDIIATWKHGYMEYELTRFSPYFPDARARIEVYALNPEDGFYVHYEVTSDAQVVFGAFLGGITDYIGRFDNPRDARRDFQRSDCADNRARCGDGYGEIAGPHGECIRIGCDFDAEITVGSAAAMLEPYPAAAFAPSDGEASIVKLSKVIRPGRPFTGNIVVLRNGTAAALQDILAEPDARRRLRAAIARKTGGIRMRSPEPRLDQSVTDFQIALDASWHEPTFYHGAIGYHAPFLGWRGWYGATLAGWGDRVRRAMLAHLATLHEDAGPEKVWYDGGDRPELDHEGTQYHHCENSSGYLSALLHRDDIYDMQEVAVDMIFHELEYRGDLELGAKIFDSLAAILDWEERVLDPDGDGLYQNFLNTWISDGHVYNGGGGAQASAYNCRANEEMVKLGRKLGRDVAVFEARAAKIRHAVTTQLWLDDVGVMAEYVDTLGNRLVHPSPELSTIYLAGESGLADDFQMDRMLKFVTRRIKAITTVNRSGKLYFSSNWLPKKYSTCGIFPAENAALALAAFRAGQGEWAWQILDGLLDALALSHTPGALSHVLSAHASNDDGDLDFTDVSSTILRLFVAGVWGVDRQLLSGEMRIFPQLPVAWTAAELELTDLQIELQRKELTDVLAVRSDFTGRLTLGLPLRSGAPERVTLNGEPVAFTVAPGVGSARVEVVVTRPGRWQLAVTQSSQPRPAVSGSGREFKVGDGVIRAVRGLDDGEYELQSATRGVLKATARAGRDFWLEVESGAARWYLPWRTPERELPVAAAKAARLLAVAGEHLDLSGVFNAEITKIFERRFMAPRPQGYSIGARRNGRYAWEWNHYGHNAVVIDDGALRCAGGFYPVGADGFPTPERGDNVACVSMWENFPTALTLPLSGRARGLALYLIGATDAMQCGVVNARITVTYADGGKATTAELVHPENFDDFLVPALQTENEYFYFSVGNHGMVERVALDADRVLQSVCVEAVANMVIVGILGVTIER